MVIIFINTNIEYRERSEKAVFFILTMESLLIQR